MVTNKNKVIYKYDGITTTAFIDNAALAQLLLHPDVVLVSVNAPDTVYYRKKKRK